MTLGKFRRRITTTFIKEWLPSWAESGCFRRLEDFVKSPQLDHAIDVILVANAVVVAIQTDRSHASNEKDRLNDGMLDTFWEGCEAFFTGCYVVEALLKLLVLGPRNYFSDWKNQFDFSVTFLALATTIYVYLPNDYSDARLIRLVVMVRMMRVLRLVVATPQFQSIYSTWVKILPAATALLLLMFVLLFTFASLGMQLFGGKINKDPASPFSTALQAADDFVSDNYYANNFNDLTSGFVTLFELLVVNNWCVPSFLSSLLFFIALILGS